MARKKSVSKPIDGELVKELRLRLDLKQWQVAERGGFADHVTVTNVEKGRNQGSSDEVRSGLAKAFGLTKDQFERYLDRKMLLEDAASLAKKRDPIAHVNMAELPAELVPALELACMEGTPDYPEEAIRAAVDAGRKGTRMTGARWLEWMRGVAKDPPEFIPATGPRLSMKGRGK